jgi:hypothetical protein
VSENHENILALLVRHHAALERLTNAMEAMATRLEALERRVAVIPMTSTQYASMREKDR